MSTDLEQRFPSARIIGRGVTVAPALKSGIGLTFVLAMFGTGARLVIPILIQQAIDHGLQPGRVDIEYIMRLCLIGALCVVLSSLCLREAFAGSSPHIQIQRSVLILIPLTVIMSARHWRLRRAHRRDGEGMRGWLVKLVGVVRCGPDPSST